MSSESEMMQSESEMMQSESETLQSESETSQFESETMQSESESMRSESETMSSESEMMQSESETMQSESETLQSESETSQFESETMQSESESMRSESETLQSESESMRSESETLQIESEKSQSESEMMQSESETIQSEMGSHQQDERFGLVIVIVTTLAWEAHTKSLPEDVGRRTTCLRATSATSVGTTLWDPPELREQLYKEAIEHCRNYNTRLCAERSVRLPFLDSQTGVAQNNCYIWMEKRHRGPGLSPGQLYTYPARYWRKKRRLHPPEDLRLCEIKLQGEISLKKDGVSAEGTTLEALLRGGALEKINESKEEETLSEIQRVLANEENMEGLELEDLEDDVPKRKTKPRGRTRGVGVKRKSDCAAQEDLDKPYVCDNSYKQKHNSKPSDQVCGKRYKNRPGLSYHYAHAHLADEEGADDPDSESRSPLVLGSEGHKPYLTQGFAEELDLRSAEDLFAATSDSDTSTFHGFDDDDIGELLSNKSVHSPASNDANNTCMNVCAAKCLNSLVASAEETASIGHPSCLQFTDFHSCSHIYYHWQCIECKSCSLCGTSENDEQLLFCDDCDRGYHMYCLNPAMTLPPEGSWSCRLCLEQLKEKASACVNRP
uniref:zinc finger protein DPF3-like n=1 Tax=Pristiophorus japonicus TaxID=55135 RepID=UPI00398F2EAD